MKKLYLNPSLKEEEMKQRYRICSASQTLGITISGYSNKEGGGFTPAADEPPLLEVRVADLWKVETI